MVAWAKHARDDRRRSTRAARRSPARPDRGGRGARGAAATSSATSTAARPPMSGRGHRARRRHGHGDRDRPLRQRAGRAPRDRRRAARAACSDRVIIGNDAPSGTGVVPLGILRTMAHLASLGGVAPEIGGRHRDREHGARPRARDGHDRRRARAPTSCSSMRPIGSAADTALDALAIGDLPGVGDGPHRRRARHRAQPEHAARGARAGRRQGSIRRRPAAGARHGGRASMRFGLRLPSFALGTETASLAEMGVYLRRAEDLGFDSAMLIDHLLVAPPAYRVTWLEPITLLAALSGVTRTIRSARSCSCSRSANRSVRKGVGDARRAVGRAVDPRRRRRLDESEFEAVRDPPPRARGADERAARG